MRRTHTTTWLAMISVVGVLRTSPLPAQRDPTGEAAAGRTWRADTVTDKMDSTVTYWLVRRAKEALVGALGAHWPALQIYCSTREHRPYLQIAIEQLVKVNPGTGTAEVRVRQDTNATKTESWSVGDDYSTIFPDARSAAQGITRIKRLAESQRYLIEVPLDATAEVSSHAAPSAGPRVLEFDVSGLKGLLPGFATGCGWRM